MKLITMDCMKSVVFSVSMIWMAVMLPPQFTMDFSLCSTEVRKAVVLRSAIQKDRKEKYCLQKAWDLSMKSLILKNLKNSKEISGLDMSATRRQVRAMDRMDSR